MATATKAKEAKAAKHEPVTFVAWGTNLKMTLEAPYSVRNHNGQIVKTFTPRYLDFSKGKYVLTQETIDGWNKKRLIEDREESQPRETLTFDLVLDEIRSNPRFNTRHGFWEIQSPPDALSPSVEEMATEIVAASATQNVAEIKRLLKSEKDTHDRAEVKDMGNAALKAIAASDEPAEESADADV